MRESRGARGGRADSRAAARAEGTEKRAGVEDLGGWIAETCKSAPPKSPLGKALTYATNQWPPLTRFLEDGRLQIHNNACERALRRMEQLALRGLGRGGSTRRRHLHHRRHVPAARRRPVRVAQGRPREARLGLEAIRHLSTPAESPPEHRRLIPPGRQAGRSLVGGCGLPDAYV